MRKNSESRNNSDSNWMKRNNVETTKMFTPLISDTVEWKINKQIAIPLLQKISIENQQIQTDIKKLGQQMGKVASLGHYLAEENQRMRVHYMQRNNDVQNMIRTMEINIQVQTSDLQHQIHLLKQNNCIIFKNIESSTNSINNHLLTIEQIKKKLQYMNEKNIDSTENILNPIQVKLNKKLNENFITKLKTQKDKLVQEQEYLMNSVLELTIQTNKLAKKNKQKNHNAELNTNKNYQEKQEFKTNIIHALKSLIELKEEIDSLNSTLTKQQEINMELKVKSQNLSKQCQELAKSKEQKMVQISNVQFQREKQIQAIKENKKIVSELEIKRMNQNDQKMALIKEVEKKRKLQSEKKNQYYQQKRNAERQISQAVSLIRRKIAKCEEEGQKQVKNLKENMSDTQNNLDLVRRENQQLENDLLSYKQMINKLQNPVEEIQRTKLMLRLKSSRPVLSRINDNF